MELVLVAGTSLPGTALALDNDVITPSVFVGYRYESNVFRLPDDSNAPGNGSTTIRTGGVGLRIDKTYGLQNFKLDANLTRFLYSKFSYLDATNRDINSTLALKVTPSFGANLLYHHSVTPNNFADTGFQNTKNLRTIDDKRIDTDWLPNSLIHPQISVLQNTARSERPTFQQENSSTKSVMASLIYRAASDNSLEMYVRRANGKYQGFVDDPTQFLATDFRETEAGVRTRWIYSGLSTVNGYLGYLKRTHDGLSSRDFSGFIGHLDGAYQITGKTKIEINFDRQLYSSQADISSYVTQDNIGTGVRWSATDRINVRPSLYYQRRVFKGARVPVLANLREFTRGASFDVIWSPFRSLDVIGTLARETRTTTTTNLDYKNNSAQITGRFHF